MSITIREYADGDFDAMAAVWNEVVESGDAFPQEEPLSMEDAKRFFAAQTRCAVAEDAQTKELLGLYILHPNNVGRCGHIANASYAVRGSARGRKIGEALVRDSLSAGKHCGFRILQFNAVVASNAPARKLYEKLGFHLLGIVPGGFRLKSGRYEDIVLYYHAL